MKIQVIEQVLRNFLELTNEDCTLNKTCDDCELYHLYCSSERVIVISQEKLHNTAKLLKQRIDEENKAR